jgi:pyruvate formate lyase activating enzyme
MDGMITNIQRASLHDGPGIRTTIFLKGCTMRCKWCHNPETINPQPEIQYFANKCIGCGQCVNVCQSGARRISGGTILFTRTVCHSCCKCIEICPTKALSLSGEKVSTERVLTELLKDYPFYLATGGGVTFSGGEPLYQIDFLKALLIGCRKAKIHTAVDTAGNVPWHSFLEIIPYVDMFLFDIKTLDPSVHKQVTGVDNHRLLDNLDKLSSSGASIRIRVPVIPGVNDTRCEMEKIAAFLKDKKGVHAVDILPFHQMAQHKYDSLAQFNNYFNVTIPSAELMSSFNEVFSSFQVDA